MAMRIKAALIIMSIVSVITAAYFFLSLSFTRHNLFKTMEQDLSLARDIADDLISTTIRLLKSDAATVAERVLKAGTDSEMKDILDSQLYEFPRFSSLTVYDRNGMVANGGEPVPENDIHLNYLQIAFNGETIISTTHYNDLRLFIMHVFVPMGPDKVLSATFSGMIFANLLSNYRLWQTGSIFVIDETGTVIAHYRADLVLSRRNYIEQIDEAPGGEVLQAFMEQVISTESGLGFYFFEGKERFCSYKRVSGSEAGWSLIVAVPLDESPLGILQTGLLLSGLCFLGLGLILSLIISRYVVQPYYKIEDQNRDLAELNEKVMAASEAKSNFLASMSHEMRTPLNAVIGLSELTLGTGTLSGDNFSNLEKINNAGMTLLSTVNDLLDISKIEAGKFELIPVEYDTPSLLNDAITQSIMRIGDKPIQFLLDLDENLPTRLRGDDLRVKQLLNNLLSNAFKYTKEGTVELSVNSEIEGDKVLLTVSVKDTGIGIRPEHLAKLFDEYSQVDTMSNRKIEGTGLGLSITKKISEMMDGSVSAQSVYGKGSVFTVCFRQQFVCADVIGPEVVNSLRNFRYSDQKRRESIRMTRIALPYARVLIVDDVATNLDVAKGMMKPYGMQVDCVASGQEAIDIIRDGSIRYNAIFMDHMMPEMDGIEAVRIIREEIGTEYAKTVPIIALTANAIVGNEKMFLSKGFQAFLSKPIEIERLDSVIREWIRDRELEKTLVGREFTVNGQTYVFGSGEQERRAVSDRKRLFGRRGADKRIDGIDIDRGMERFGDDEESFIQVLDSYAANTRLLLEKTGGVNRENLADYAIAVHGIKGSSRGICAEQIGAMAEALEKAAKNDDIGYVTANNALMMEAADKLIKNIEDVLQEIRLENPRPKKDKPDSELLDRLAAACGTYNMDGVDAAMAEIANFEYGADNGLAAWLKENVDLMNFDLIVKKLSEEKNG